MKPIRIPTHFMGKPIRGAMKRLEEAERARKKQKPIQKSVKIDSFSDKGDYWEIKGVEYRNGIYTINLLKSLLDSGASKTQEQWTEYSENAIQKGNFHSADFPLFYSLFRTMYQNNTSEIKEARDFIKKQMFDKWLITLTRISYQPKGKDEIIHNYNLDNQYSIKEDFVGPDEFIKQSSNTSYLEAVLLTKDVKEINSVFKWLTDKDAYIRRLNNKPENIIERVAGFDANSGRAYLYCDWYPSGSDASLGVFACAEGAHARI